MGRTVPYNPHKERRYEMIKQCVSCNRTFSLQSFLGLHFYGFRDFFRGSVLELRKCKCHKTISIEHELSACSRALLTRALPAPGTKNVKEAWR